MFNSLKTQNRIRLTNGKTLQVLSAQSGRDKPAVAVPEEVAAIERAMHHGEPVFIVEHANGTVYDVMTNRESAIKYRDEKRESLPKFSMYDALDDMSKKLLNTGTPRRSAATTNMIRLFERRGQYLFSI